MTLLSGFVLQTLRLWARQAHAEDNTPAQALGMGLVAMGHHTEVVGTANVEAEDVLVHHVPHKRVQRRTKGTVVTRRWRLRLRLPY